MSFGCALQAQEPPGLADPDGLQTKPRLPQPSILKGSLGRSKQTLILPNEPCNRAGIGMASGWQAGAISIHGDPGSTEW